MAWFSNKPGTDGFAGSNQKVARTGARGQVARAMHAIGDFWLEMEGPGVETMKTL
jgi:hypothetical protein